MCEEFEVRALRLVLQPFVIVKMYKVLLNTNDDSNNDRYNYLFYQGAISCNIIHNVLIENKILALVYVKN